jgi:hypothetical protein
MRYINNKHIQLLCAREKRQNFMCSEPVTFSKLNGIFMES